MQGLIMDFQLTIPAMLRRAEQLHYDREVVTRQPDRSLHRCTYADTISRAKRLAVALKRLGLADGDRVATFCWNHYQHLEAYIAIPCAGGVLHTLNLRLHPNDLTYIAGHAGDRVAIVDEVLWDTFDKFRGSVDFKQVIVVRQATRRCRPARSITKRSSPTPTSRNSNTSISTNATPRPCATPPARPACQRACWRLTAPSCSTRWPAR